MSTNSCLLVIERINPSSSHQIPTRSSTVFSLTSPAGKELLFCKYWRLAMSFHRMIHEDCMLTGQKLLLTVA